MNTPIISVGYTPPKQPSKQYIRVMTLEEVNAVCPSTISADEFYAATYTGMIDLWDPAVKNVRVAFHGTPETAALLPPKNASDSPINGKLLRTRSDTPLNTYDYPNTQIVPNFWVEFQYAPFPAATKKYNLFHQLSRNRNIVTAVSNLGGTGFPRNPTLTVLDGPVSQVIDPISANLFDETTTSPKTIEDSAAFLGSSPTMTQIVTTSNENVTVNQNLIGVPRSMVIVQKNDAGQFASLDIGSNILMAPSSYAVVTNSNQKYGVSVEFSYNIGAKMGSYLSQCDRVNLAYTLPDDQFTYKSCPINDIRLEGVFSTLWARSYAPGALVSSSPPSPKTFPFYKIGGSSGDLAMRDISQNQPLQQVLNQTFYTDDYNSAWQTLGLGQIDLSVSLQNQVIYNSQDDKYQFIGTSQSTFLHCHGTNSPKDANPAIN